MSKKNIKRNSRNTASFGGRILALVLALLAAASAYINHGSSKPFEVHFIDVDQADCALVIADGKTMLIDGGNPGDGPKILQYLSAQGVHKIDLLVATHPHADHIGGLPYVVENFPVGHAWISSCIHTTATYEALLDNLDKKNVDTEVPKVGQEYALGGANCRVILNGDGFDDPNDASVMVRVAYGSTSVMFTGDAEYPAEEAALQGGLNLRSTVLKVGHHGSETSSSPAFLAAVEPEIAVISCGRDNTYGHPHAAALKRLTCEVHRTDEEGSVVLGSDGQTVTVKGSAPVFQFYIGNTSNGKYHRLGCEYMPSFKRMAFFWNRTMATEAGFVACGSCKP